MQYITTHKDKNIKMVLSRINEAYDEKQEYIWRLERRALQLHDSIQAFCRYANLENKIFIRLRQRGLYAINYLTLLRLCYGLNLTADMVMGFIDWDDIPLTSITLNKTTIEKVRIDWRKSMDEWYKSKKQKPQGTKPYGEIIKEG